jgi:hypothetical protein
VRISGLRDSEGLQTAAGSMQRSIRSSLHAPHDRAACMCTHGPGGQSTDNATAGTCSAADAEIGAAAGGPTAQSSVRPCASAHACKALPVACTGKELETLVGRAGCFAFLPNWSLCRGGAVLSSGSGRFDCTCAVGVRSKRPMGAGAARVRGARTGAPASLRERLLACRALPDLSPD